MADQPPSATDVGSAPLRVLVDGAATHAVIGLDPDGLVTFWSKGAERLLGWSEAELMGKPGSIIFVPEDRESGVPERELAAAAREGSAEDVRWHGRKDGSRFWANGNLDWLDDGSGFVKIMRDWTRQHQTEQALTESEERVRRVVESATEYAIFTTDREGRVTSWNSGAQRILGYAEDEIVGQDVRTLFLPEERERGDPEREMAEALKADRSHNERWHIREDGGLVWSSQTLMPLRDERGDPQGFLKILRDRTAKKRAEDALRESETRLRTLATTIPQLVWRSRNEGDWTWASPQWESYTGQADIETHGSGWLEAVHPEDRERTIAAWRKAADAGELHVEHRLRNAADGAYRWFQTRALPLRDEAGRTIEWFGTSTDVQNLKRLQEHQQMILAELQHRTRNLLAVVRSIAGQTIRASETFADFERRFNSRLSALSRVQSLFARGDSDSVTVGEIVRLELAAHGAEHDGERVIVGGPAVRLPDRSIQTMTLALHELGTNALKYGALAMPDGRLEVVWDLRNGENGAPDRLRLEWRESGVRLGKSYVPERRGYGRELIEGALAYDLDAETKLEFGLDGVLCLIDVPLVSGGGQHG